MEKKFEIEVGRVGRVGSLKITALRVHGEDTNKCDLCTFNKENCAGILCSLKDRKDGNDVYYVLVK